MVVSLTSKSAFDGAWGIGILVCALPSIDCVVSQMRRRLGSVPVVLASDEECQALRGVSHRWSTPKSLV